MPRVPFEANPEMSGEVRSSRLHKVCYMAGSIGVDVDLE